MDIKHILKNITELSGGLLAWSFTEYVLHRGMHQVQSPLHARHLHHHRYPEIPSSALPSAIAITALLCSDSLFLLGFIVGFFDYEWRHSYEHHHPANDHTVHHGQPTVNFGVTSLVWDRVFQTASYSKWENSNGNQSQSNRSTGRAGKRRRDTARSY